MKDPKIIYRTNIDDQTVQSFLAESADHLKKEFASCGWQLDRLIYNDDEYLITEVHKGETVRKARLPISDDPDDFEVNLDGFLQFLSNSDPVKDAEPFGPIRDEIQKIMETCDYYGQEMGRYFFIQDSITASYLCLDQWEVKKHGNLLLFDGVWPGTFPEAWKHALKVR